MNNRKKQIERITGEKIGKTLFLKRGAIMIHKTGKYKSFGELINVYQYKNGFYIGNLAEPFGMLMINVQFRKKDCIKLSPKETKKAFLKFHDEECYKLYFGREAV